MPSELAMKIVKQINKKEKAVVVQTLGDPAVPITVEDVLSTGLPNLDVNLAVSVDGRYGLPVGRIISVKAKPSIGKTSFVFHVARQVQKRGGVVWMVESEHALDLAYIRNLKCDPDDMLISQPDYLEGALQTIETGLNACSALRDAGDNSPFLIIVDSFSGFTTEAEASGGAGLGEHARLAARACRKMTGLIASAKAILLVVHQTKSKIGIMWGSPDTNIGGDAFNFHDSICISMYRTSAVKKDKAIIGHFGVFKTTKNKLAPPFRECKFQLINGKGFVARFSIFEHLLNTGHIKKKGSWFNLKDKKFIRWQGREGFDEILRTKKKARIYIKRALKESLRAEKS